MTQQQKPRQGEIVPRDQAAQTVGQLVQRMMGQIKRALPKHMDPDRMARVFLTAVNKNSDLQKATTASLLGALMECTQLGLEPDGVLGHGYLIPFKNKGVMECQFMPGYRGLMVVARRGGEVVSLTARVVHRKDHFKYQYGAREILEHVPYAPRLLEAEEQTEMTDAEWDRLLDRGPVDYVYAVAKLRDQDEPQFDVMTRLEVDAIRARSKSSGTGPWVTDYEAMAKKTVLKRLMKFLPGSVEKDRAVSLSDHVEANISQELSAQLPDDPEPTPKVSKLDDIAAKHKKNTDDGPREELRQPKHAADCALNHGGKECDLGCLDPEPPMPSESA